jgi:glycosyltransferase involved in cell wall biosynthesis
MVEIGNELTRRGHRFVLFTPEGMPPDWLDFQGLAKPFASLAGEDLDIGLCSEYSILDAFDRLKAKKKIFYFILDGHKQEREVAGRDYLFLGNSEGLCRRLEKKHGIPVLRAPGGINPRIFYPLARPDSKNAGRPFRILCYGRVYKKRKGIRNIIRAVEGLYSRYPQLRLVFFDSRVGRDRQDARLIIKTRVPYEFHLDLPQAGMADLFSRADLFVSAERRAGWSNTTAEAMACGLPVVCTKSGTRDFAFHGRTALVVPFPFPFLLRRAIKKLIQKPDLRGRLASSGHEKILEFTWQALGGRLEAIFRQFAN